MADDSTTPMPQGSTSPKRQLALTQMRAGQQGTVIGVLGGRGLTHRLDAIGIRAGKKITKISTMLLRGAITLQVNGTRLAIGFGMASKILVEVDDPS